MWWRRPSDGSPEDGRPPYGSAEPPPARSRPAAFTRPAGPVTAQQAMVWDIIEGWEPEYEDPVGVLHHLKRLARRRGGPDDVPLTDLGLGRQDGAIVRFFAGVSPVAARRRTSAAGFLLLVALDAEPPSVMPEIIVVTPDLQPRITTAEAESSPPASDQACTVVEYARRGPASGERVVHRLTQTAADLDSVLRAALAAG